MLLYFSFIIFLRIESYYLALFFLLLEQLYVIEIAHVKCI